MSISAMEYAGSECLDAGERSRVRSLIWIQSEEGDFDGGGSTITIQWVIRLERRVITWGSENAPRQGKGAARARHRTVLHVHPL